MFIELVMPSSHLILSPFAFNLSQQQGFFQSVGSLHQMTKYWSLRFSISLSNEYSGLISFRIDWFDLAVQGTLKSRLQHHSSKASILQRSSFFTMNPKATLPVMLSLIILGHRGPSFSWNLFMHMAWNNISIYSFIFLGRLISQYSFLQDCLFLFCLINTKIKGDGLVHSAPFYI